MGIEYGESTLKDGFVKNQIEEDMLGIQMDTSALFVGIEYGAETVKIGLVNAQGSLIGKTSKPTADRLDKPSCRKFSGDVAGFIQHIGVYSSELDGVAIAVPGTVEDGMPVETPGINVDWALLLEVMKKGFPRKTISIVGADEAVALAKEWLGEEAVGEDAGIFGAAKFAIQQAAE